MEERMSIRSGLRLPARSINRPPLLRVTASGSLLSCWAFAEYWSVSFQFYSQEQSSAGSSA